MGYKDTELQLFVKEQQTEERTQRNLDREAQLHADKMKMKADKMKMEADKMKMEAQLQADRIRIEVERMANDQRDKDRDNET
mgnify:CR=1 FL=1